MTRAAPYRTTGLLTGLLTGLVTTALLAGCGQRAGEADSAEAHAGPAVTDAAPPETPEKPGAAHLTEADFDGAIARGVALVDFWAAWCPPCRIQGPVVDKLASEYEGRPAARNATPHVVAGSEGLSGPLVRNPG